MESVDSSAQVSITPRKRKALDQPRDEIAPIRNLSDKEDTAVGPPLKRQRLDPQPQQ
ncbi:hypothetical protein B0H19DRAFT_1172970 [Mycena capillaripes]|nr:hypothetical protein B0H19DRAFT_1172970 [Mycena capillaripes]